MSRVGDLTMTRRADLAPEPHHQGAPGGGQWVPRAAASSDAVGHAGGFPSERAPGGSPYDLIPNVLPSKDLSFPAFVSHIDAPSFTAGVACALAGVFVALVVLKLGRPVIKLALCLALVGLFAGSYFGWTRRAAGLGADALAGPKAIVDDARSAVDKMNDRMRQQEQQLRDIAKEH